MSLVFAAFIIFKAGIQYVTVAKSVLETAMNGRVCMTISLTGTYGQCEKSNKWLRQTSKNNEHGGTYGQCRSLKCDDNFVALKE